MNATTPAASVIVPVHNSRETLEPCLDALRASDERAEVVVVDDGSRQDLQQLVESRGYRYLRHSETPQGPAAARNAGVAEATGDLLIFIDADVLVHRDTIGRFRNLFVSQPDLAAAFGSYDNNPPVRSLVSRYKNLLHHFVHQHANPEACTFWAGCGAIRRHDFEAVGGFSSQYRRPQIEDIELGVRLHQAGRQIAVRPEIQATHLKRWSFGNLLKTDIFARALPWSRLICHGMHKLPNDLNLDLAARLSGALALSLLLAMTTGAISIIIWPTTWWIAAGSIGILLLALAWLNRRLLQFFYQRGGPAFTLGAAGLHLLYFIYSSLTFAWVRVVESRLRPARHLRDAASHPDRKQDTHTRRP